jgi:surfeit locus 1 family protein
LAAKSFLAPTLFTIGGMALLLGLGTWQVERLHWKEGLIAARTAAVTAPPAPLPATLAAARGLEFHHTRATGRFLNDREFYLHATNAAGDAGYQIVTPLRLAEGGFLLVDRGFVPTERKAPQDRGAGQIEGEVSVTGLLRLHYAGKPGWFVPDNEPARNEWFYIDIPAMAKAEALDPVLSFYLDADVSANPDGGPVGGQTVLDLPNNHLQYAITWYALAAGLLAVYIAVWRRHRASGSP